MDDAVLVRRFERVGICRAIGTASPCPVIRPTERQPSPRVLTVVERRALAVNAGGDMT
jgi:hypothetical protein